MTLAEQRKKILKQLDALKVFNDTAVVRKLRQELTGKLRAIEAKIKRGRQSKIPIPKADIRKMANASRAASMRKHHNYIKQIHTNYPDLSYREIQRQLKERKQGKQTKISDVIWHNPSP